MKEAELLHSILVRFRARHLGTLALLVGLTIGIGLPVLAQNTVDETTLAPAPVKAPPDLFHNQMPGYDLPVVEEDPSAPARRAEAKKTGAKRSGSRIGSLLGFGNSPDDLDISGSQSLTFRSISVSGSGASNYYNQFWNSESFETRTDLFMRGRIWKEFNINATLASGTFSTNRNRYSLSYNGHDTDVTYGYINAELGGNRYLSLNKSLKGYKLESQLFDKYGFSAFTTEATGTVKNEVFSGNGTSGPYFLRYTPIREGSEELRLDERELVFGQDYKLNYITGQLDFKQGLIIPPSSQVAVSYEQAQSGGEGGNLTGYQLALPLSDKLSVNVMRAEQDSGSTGIPTAQITAAEDNYYGNNSTGPFVLVYKPILRSVTPIIYRLFGGELQNAGTDRPYVTVSPWMVGPYLDGENLYFAGLSQKPIQVLVGGIVQDEGLDYVVSYDTSTVTFLKAISPLLPVEIDYYALQANGSLLIDGQVVQAVTVYVDGQLQTEGIDFILTYDTGVIQFTHNVALNARVLVEYYYYQQPESFSGMRRVDGLTARYRVADGVELGLQYARSGSRYDYSTGEVPAGQAKLLNRLL